MAAGFMGMDISAGTATTAGRIADITIRFTIPSIPFTARP
jgi:hypothetical protein